MQAPRRLILAVLFLAVWLLLLLGCSGKPAPAEEGRYRVRFWHYGQSLPHEWRTDAVNFGHGRAYFTDKRTGRLIELMGSVIVDQPE